MKREAPIEINARRGLRDRLRGALQRFGREERATSMTEFVIVLPIFITVFAGIVHLGKLVRPGALNEATAHRLAFDKARDVQSRGLSLSGLEHSLPTVAGATALAQMADNLPRQRGVYRAAIVAAETDAYAFGGLAHGGHLGESYARLRVPRALGLEVTGVDEAVAAGPDLLIGESQLAKSIIDDDPNAYFDSGDTMSHSDGIIERGLALLNAGIDTVGARAALAAGIRYGTVTGFSQQSVSAAGFTADHKGHHTLTVAPFVAEHPWDNQMRATLVSRVTMASDYRYEGALPGFNDQTLSIHEIVTDPARGVWGPEEVPLSWPLDYDASINVYLR